jgi:Zn-dependent peptidase ImmA (M78 family)
MAGWNPWAAARAVPHLEIWFADVPDGATWHREEDADHITIDARATRRERRALLAHELVHVERGIGYPAATPATMQREEAIVRREVAARLVPPDALEDLVARRSDVEPVTALVVAEEFDVPEDVAREALLALGQRGPTGLRSSRPA